MESSLCLWELVSIDYRNCTHQMVDPMPVVSHSCNDIYIYIYLFIYLLIYFSFIYLFKVYLLIYLYIFIYTYVITMETAGVGTKEQWKKKQKHDGMIMEW